jgi:hypothetical protein
MGAGFLVNARTASTCPLQVCSKIHHGSAAQSCDEGQEKTAHSPVLLPVEERAHFFGLENEPIVFNRFPPIAKQGD